MIWKIIQFLGIQSKVGNKISQTGQNVANQAKRAINEQLKKVQNEMKKKAAQAAKAAAKAVAKVVMTIGKAIVQFIVATAPISLIVIAIIILALIAYAAWLAAFNWFTGITKRDMETSNVTTSEVGSIYDDSNENNIVAGDNKLTLTSTDEVATIAHDIKKYIKEKGFTYKTGNVMNYPDSGSRVIDCSTFVTWVLIEFGYDEFKGKAQLTTRDFLYWIKGGTGENHDLSHYDWEWESTQTGTPQPGDLLLKGSTSTHIEIFAGDGVGTYGAGSDDQIKREGYISYRGYSTKRIIREGNFDYIIRVTKRY